LEELPPSAKKEQFSLAYVQMVASVVTQIDDGLESENETESAQYVDALAPFPRRVMVNLARGLETTRDLAEGKSTSVMEDPARWGLSAGLVESVEEMVGPEGLRSLELRFEWAAGRPKPDVGTEPITLERAQAGELARAREKLLPAEEPSHRETLVGQVKSLTRDETNPDADEAGSIVISAEVNGRYRNVHMTLTGEDHENAISAYRSQLPLVLSGDLFYERGAWRLGGDMEVDTTVVSRSASRPAEGTIVNVPDNAPQLPE
jgi:hypothetical protein